MSTDTWDSELPEGAFYLLDQDGKFADLSPALASYLGYAREQLLGKSIARIEATPGLSEDLARIERVAEMGSDRSRPRYRRRDGREVEVEVSSYPMSLGGQRFVFGAVRDVSNGNGVARPAPRGNPDDAASGYCLVDQDGVIRDADPTLLSWLGYRREQVIGRMRGEDLFLEQESPLRTQVPGAGVLENAELVREDGGRLPAKLQWLAEGEAGGRPATVHVTVHRVPDEPKTEIQLLQSQRLETLGTLVGGVAHEFNNMLTGILGFTQLLLRTAEPSDRSRENLHKLEMMAERAAKVVKQLLAVTRKDPGQRGPLMLHPFLREIAELLQRMLPETIEVELSLTSEDLAVLVDPGQLHQVLMNLAVNARDAMPEGGRLLIHTCSAHLGDGFCAAHPGMSPGPYVRISVTDTGTGVPKEIQDQIFDPFFTTKSVGKGSGLGLSIAQAIARDHGGIIDVETEEGRGTTMRLYLPSSEKGLAVNMAPNTGEGHGTETVLLVEDEPAVLELSRQALEHFGYQVLMATDGVAALEVYRANHEGIAVVVLDLVMPRMGGLRALKELRELNPAVRVILTTGYGSTEELPDATPEEHGCELLQKPYTIQALARAVRSAIDGPKPIQARA